MNSINTFSALIVSSLCLAGCGGGGGSADSTSQKPDSDSIDLLLSDVAPDDSPLQDPVNDREQGPDTTSNPVLNTVSSDQARYRVTLENLWGVEDFPQGFPENAHLSLLGGATHNVSVSFWDMGDVASDGIEDMAEAGLIDKLLFDEVAPAITNGTANEMIEVREFTDAKIDGAPGVLTFEIDMNVQWPLVSMVTMLGPSPDWFVGVSGLPLYSDDSWITDLTMDLPMYDAGTKSDITPVMGGPDIVPANPIGLVAYDAATGVYLPSDEPQNVARLSFERIE